MSLGSKVRYNLLSSFLEASSILTEGRLARNSSGISLILFFETTSSSKLRSLVSTLGMEVIWLLGEKREEGREEGGGEKREEERGRRGEKGKRREERKRERREERQWRNVDTHTEVVLTNPYYHLRRVTKCLTRIQQIQVF